jgi:gluconate 5-dehydrogenase
MADGQSLVNRLFSLEGKTALVTGASGGIGGALAIAVAEAGAYVALSGTNMENLQETASAIEAKGGKYIILPADLRDVEACKKLVYDAKEQLGSIDILWNNAGMNRRKRVEEFTLDDYETIMDVNLRSILFLSQAAHAVMKEQGGGKIINIGSMTSYIGLANVGIYGMSKSALAQFTRTMAIEWARDNIQVNCLAPGFIKTPLTAQGQWADPHISQWILDRVPARRPGTPDDLVGTALWLSSASSDFVTGQIVAVDGGFLAGGSWLQD